MSVPPVIADVAELAGVSVATVSLVLNGKGNISEATRARVTEAAQTLGYTPSAHARNLRGNQARVVGYAYDRNRSRFNPVLDSFLYEILRISESHGRNVLLFAHESGTGVEAYRSLVKSRRVDGFILSHTQQDDERFAYLQSNHIPFAAFGRSNSVLDARAHWVDVDGEAGMCEAVQHLIDCGKRRIGFIGWPQGSVSGDARYTGYFKTLQAAGLPINFNWIRRTQNDINSGYEAGQSLMSQPEPPDAIAAVSDIVAVGVLRGMLEMGQQIAVTGFDDTPIAEFSHPPLTSLQQPVDEVARLLMEMLIAQFEKQPVVQPHHLLKPRLVVRASSTLAY